MQITEMLLTNPTARPGTKIVPKGLVIHWTANEKKGADAVANRNYFNKPTTEASAHYIVDDVSKSSGACLRRKWAITWGQNRTSQRRCKS